MATWPRRFVIVMLLIIFSTVTSHPAHALTGLGLPGGCHGGERRYEVSYPFDWEIVPGQDELRLIYILPNNTWCWVSHLSRVDTSTVQGGSDRWNAVLRNNYYSGGRDRLEVMVPKTFWLWQYLYYRAIGFNMNDALDLTADLFWVWGYYY